MCFLCAEMWFQLVESDRFSAIFLHGTVIRRVDLNTCTRTRTHTHTPSSERRTLAQINFSRLGLLQGSFKSDWCSGGSAVAVECCDFWSTHYTATCLRRKRESREKGAKQTKTDARVPTTLSLAVFAQLVFPQFSTAQHEPVFTCTQVSTSTLLLKAVSKRYSMTGSKHPNLRGEPARPGCTTG